MWGKLKALGTAALATLLFGSAAEAGSIYDKQLKKPRLTVGTTLIPWINFTLGVENKHLAGYTTYKTGSATVEVNGRVQEAESGIGVGGLVKLMHSEPKQAKHSPAKRDFSVSYIAVGGEYEGINATYNGKNYHLDNGVFFVRGFTGTHKLGGIHLDIGIRYNPKSGYTEKIIRLGSQISF